MKFENKNEQFIADTLENCLYQSMEDVINRINEQPLNLVKAIYDLAQLDLIYILVNIIYDVNGNIKNQYKFFSELLRYKIQEEAAE